MTTRADSFIEPMWKLARNVAGVLRTADRSTSLSYLSGLAIKTPAIVRARNLVPADLTMRGRTIRFFVDGTEVTLSGSDFSGAREMYCRRVYFASRMVQLQPGGTVIDLGANVGLFTTLAARRGCRVIAVEAQDELVRLARMRLAQNACEEKASLICGLVGCGAGVLSSATDVAKLCRKPEEDVQVVTMQSLFERFEIDSVCFLKVDIEGSEFALFREYEPWMSRVARIAMEVHPTFGDVGALIRVLHTAGFRTEQRDENLRLNNDPQREGYVYAWRP